MDKNVYKIAWAEGVRREVVTQTDTMLRNHGMTRENSFVASRAVANGVMNTLLMAIIAKEIQVLKGDPDFDEIEDARLMDSDDGVEKEITGSGRIINIELLLNAGRKGAEKVLSDCKYSGGVRYAAEYISQPVNEEAIYLAAINNCHTHISQFLFGETKGSDVRSFLRTLAIDESGVSSKPSPSNYPTVTAREFEASEKFYFKGFMYVGNCHPFYNYGDVYFVTGRHDAKVHVCNNIQSSMVWADDSFMENFRPLA